jgi:hypothetical protein
VVLISLSCRESNVIMYPPRNQILFLDRSSTLENWCREFARFAPSISVQTYYAGKEERPLLRQTLADTQSCKSRSGEGWEVLITTYNLAQGDERDRKFFRKMDWDVSCSFLFFNFSKLTVHHNIFLPSKLVLCL